MNKIIDIIPILRSPYSFGFNGKENDSEVYGDGGFQDYGMRSYDTRIGRFISVDPLTKEFPELTPYQFASNTPISAVDLDGEEAYWVFDKFGKLSEPVIKLYNLMYGWDEAYLRSLVIHRGVEYPDVNKAETWGVNDVRTNNQNPKMTTPQPFSEAYWYATLAHEFTHEQQFRNIQLPDKVIRFLSKTNILSREYLLFMSHDDAYQYSVLEKSAFKNGKEMAAFIENFQPQIVFRSKILTDSEKSDIIERMVTDFKKGYDSSTKTYTPPPEGPLIYIEIKGVEIKGK